MKRIVLLVLCLVTFVGIAHADQFQFLYWNGQKTYYVSYSNVRVYNANNEWIFNGYTDQYGGITINLSNGNYNCYVYYREKWWYVRLGIDGRRELKTIYLR